MPDPKIIDFPLGLPLTTILNGESFYCDFDLTELFGKLIDITTDYTDVKIYLYHKQLLKNVGNILVLDPPAPPEVYHEYWGEVDGNVEITGANNDQARIKVTEDLSVLEERYLTDELKTGTYMFMVSLEDDDTSAHEKDKGDAFIIKTAIDE